jgi:hypothetical protein
LLESTGYITKMKKGLDYGLWYFFDIY